MFKTLITRTLAGVVFVVLILGSVFWHPIALALLLYVLTWIGLQEFYGLFQKAEIIRKNKWGIIIGLFVYSVITAWVFGWIPGFAMLSAFPFIFLLFVFELYKKDKAPFNQIAIQVLGILYVAIPFSLYHLVQQYPVGGESNFEPWLLAGVFILIWANDTFAYLFGSAFGKHKLFERISPKKSWEGTIGGAVSTFGIAWILGTYLHILDLNEWFILAAIIIPTAVFGDLTESMLKRSLNIKDSGNIMPGHGGVLDRFDAANFALPFIVLFLYLLL